jgi:hypothetical protein
MPLTVDIENPADRAAAEQAVFGHPITDLEYADMAGDLLGDAEVHVRYNEPWLHGGGPDARIRIRGQNRLAVTKVRLIPGRFDFSECRVQVPGHGIGALILYRVARAAKEHGFDRLTGRGEKALDPQTGVRTSWGYYAFTRLGFDADIPGNTPPRPPGLAACTRISQLLHTEAGKEFWWEKGVEVASMEFDLNDSSPSWQTLQARLA